jgi:type IV pilus assembly protein PilM
MKSSIFYNDKPIFGFDIGYDSVKVMQIDTSTPKHKVLGYSFTSFTEKAIKNGVIVDPEAIAKEVYPLFTRHMIGSINTNRVAVALPISKTFNRVLTLPKMPINDLESAIKAEAEQYIPVSVEQLYIDYDITEGSTKDTNEILIVAAPKDIVDSYLTLFDMLGLEVALLETSISAATRLVMQAEQNDVPTLIIDFGSVSTDLSIFDSTLRVTGTVSEGGDTITKAIADKLVVTMHQAQTIKTKHGLGAGKRQAQIKKALEPLLNKMVIEIKKMVRFYQERSGVDKKLEQVIILGGGANMPGFADYITDKVRIPARTCNPWLNLDFGDLQPPHQLEKTLYATSAGLAIVDPRSINK